MDYLPFGEEYPAVGYPSSTERTGVKFTGKEKDAETGLDYFLARYFSSSQGRFTSVDAKGFSKRTLRNPQKWNKYAYVLNNPLQYVDPDGLEELKVTIRTTIPYATTWLGATYSGGRKTTTQMIVETRRMGGASPVRSLTETVHPTKLLWPVKMEATAPKSAQVDGYKYTPEGQVVTIVQDTKNPLAPVPGFLTPGVTANLDIEFDEDADWIRVTGTTSQFPSFDISVTRANGETVPVYHRDPWFNSTLLLFLPHRVDTGQVPLRRSDSEQPRKEHKNCLQNRDGTCVQ
jgi:RHS repeat-associated protein